MTIIVCGYTHKLKEKIDYAQIWSDVNKEQWSFQDRKIIDADGNELADMSRRKKYERPELNHQNYELVLDDYYKSTFYLCDSGISVGNNLAYIDNFFKVESIDLKLYQPYFVGEYFHSYNSVYLTRKVAIGFAGNVNLAKLCIAYIREHLEQLRISCKDFHPIEYNIRKHCDKNNPLEVNSDTTGWDESLFGNYNEKILYTGEQVSEFIEHSINAGYERIRKNLSNLKANTAIREKDIIAEFAVTIYCPSKNKNEIYVYRPKFIENEFGVPNGKLIAEKHLLPEDQIAILGTKAITQDLEQQYSNLLTDIKNPQEELFKSVNQYIKNQISECIFNVNLPSNYFQFDQYKGLTIIKRLKE
ncbi:hypothetical protein [Acinetobacter indicus]|uniref:hypothetical protein n=1 Tax=Acinetobacter indicus TaxID=756892 RepID=UPI000CEC82BC|nr:hypothetical protein [Acinetobacter indicus]